MDHLNPDEFAASIGLSDDDWNKICSWLNGGNEVAQALNNVLTRTDRLSLRQWEIARAAAIDGKSVKLKVKPSAPVRNPRVSFTPAKLKQVTDVLRKQHGYDGLPSASTVMAFCDANGIMVQSLLDAAEKRIQSASSAFAAIGKTSVQGAIIDWQRVREISREEIALRLAKPEPEKVVVLDKAGVQKTLSGAVTHPSFHLLARASACRDFSGNRLNCILVGPTGTGKSYACRQLSELHGLPFYFQSIATEPYDLVGYQRVNGEQKYTPFVVAFRDGGVCLLDELDRYDPKALVSLNAALANGAMTLDNGEVIRRHADFICVGAANTFGFGASADFTAAEKLDLSTISRFSVRIEWSVVADTESDIAAAKAEDADIARHWLAEIRKVRAAMERLGLPYLADQRTVETGANLLAAGMALEDVRAATYLAPLDTDQKTAILHAIGERQ